MDSLLIRTCYCELRAQCIHPLTICKGFHITRAYSGLLFHIWDSSRHLATGPDVLGIMQCRQWSPK